MVNAAGIWAPQVAAMVGGCDPVHAGRPPAHRARAGAGVTSCPATCRASAIRTTSSTARASTAGWSSAATRPTRSRAGRTASRGTTRPRSLPPDYERFAPLMAGAIRRFPFLADARGDPPRLPSRRDDAGLQPAARTAARRPRLLGRRGPVAQRLRRRRRDRPGDGRLDHDRGSRRGRRAVSSVAVRRDVSRPDLRGRAWPARRTPTTTAFATRSTRTLPDGRGGCRALHGRLQEHGAVFGTKAGWERADITSRAARGDGPDATRRPGAGPSRRGSGASCEEARAVRERAGIIDLSSFGKIAVEGPDALASPAARGGQRDRSAGRERRLHAVPR